MLARSHSHFVVVVGGGKQRAPRTFGKFCDRHHYRVHRFQYGTASHAHIDSQAVAASRFDSANCCAKVFWTGNLQHWRRVGLPRRAHFHPHRISTAGYFHSIQKCQLLKVASGAFVSRLFQDETRIPPGRIRTSIVRRSDASNDIFRFSRSSVSTVRGPDIRSHVSHCEWRAWGWPVAASPDRYACNRPLNTRVRTHGAASLRPPAGQLAGRATLHLCPSSRLSQSGALR
jgi:hypothetical protein